MKRKDFGFILVILAVLFGAIETIYFGNNWIAQTKAEMYCDKVVMFFFFYWLLFLV